MNDFIKNNGVIVPKPNPTKMPTFSVRLFLCHYEQDTIKFRNLVESKGGKYEGNASIHFLNHWNEAVGYQYVCIYHYYEDIEMEILC
jgi:hypothetical protein